MPPRADPRAFDIFYFFWSNSPPCGPFLWSNAPLPRDFLGVKCPTPRVEVTKPRLISANLNKVFNTAISIIFCIPVQRLRASAFFFCVHSDHLGSRYELSAFGTLQSSVSGQEEVQEHKSVHSKFCTSRVFSKGSLPSGFNYWQRSKSFVKCTFVRRNLSIFDLLARFVCSWTSQRGRIQEVVGSSCRSRCSPLLLVF